MPSLQRTSAPSPCPLANPSTVRQSSSPARWPTISSSWRSTPTTLGLPALREAIAGWAERRFGLAAGAVDPARQVLPVNGTREALFSFTQAVVNRADEGLVVSPNPFYQIYEAQRCWPVRSRTTCLPG